MTQLVIAIDGPAAAGKGTLGRRLSSVFIIPYLDTGLLYRAVGRRVLLVGKDPSDSDAAETEAKALMAADLDRSDLRDPEVDDAASKVGTVPGVRAALLSFQRNFATDHGAVLDGRDIGTVIFPHANIKFFVTATLEARAYRRWSEVTKQGRDVTLEDVRTEMNTRDTRDAARTVAPLCPACDAFLIDTSSMSADQVFKTASEVIKSAGF